MTSPDPSRNQSVSQGALLARQFVTLLVLMISLAISFTLLFVQTPQQATTSTARATLLLIWPGMRPDMVSDALTPHLAQLGDDGIVATDHHALLPGPFAVPAEHALAAQSAASRATGTPRPASTTAPTATPAPTAPPAPATPPTNLDPFVTLAQTVIAAKVPVVYEGAGGADLLRAVPNPANTYILDDSLDDSTSYPASLNGQLRAAQVTPPSDLPALDAAHAPDTARTEALTQAFIRVVLPALKSASAFLGIIRYDDPAATAALTGIGAPAFLGALKADDTALGEIIDGLRNAGWLDNTNIIVTSDHGLADVVAPNASSAATQAYTAPTSAVRTNLAALLAAEAAKGAKGALPDVGRGGVTSGVAGKTATVVVAAGGGADALTFPASAAVQRLGNGDIQQGKVTLAQEIAPFLLQQPQVGIVFVNDHLSAINGTLPLSALGALSASSPDLLVTFASLPKDVGQAGTNTAAFAGAMYADTTDLGTWGGLSRRDLHAILFADGPSFAQNASDTAPTGTLDLVPTIESLLGLHVPVNTPGRILQEMLANGPQSGPAPTTRVQAGDEYVSNNTSYLAALVFEDFANVEYLHGGAAVRAQGIPSPDSLKQQAIALADEE
jgi:arylsulfatase A-like enzyme